MDKRSLNIELKRQLDELDDQNDILLSFASNHFLGPLTGEKPTPEQLLEYLQGHLLSLLVEGRMSAADFSEAVNACCVYHMTD